MKISEMITLLEQLKEKHGDLPVHIFTDFTDEDEFESEIVVEHNPNAKCYIDNSWKTHKIATITIR